MTSKLHVWSLILVAALGRGAARAQQPGGEGGQQAGSGTQVPSTETSQAPEPVQAPPAPPDARPFSATEEFTAGSAGQVRSYFIPSFRFSEITDSNFRVGPGPQRYETVNTLVGHLTLLRAGKHSQLTADYLGGAQIYNRRTELNTTIQQLGVRQSYQGRRWSVLFDDRVSYLPESAFGFGGFGLGSSLGLDVGGAFGTNLPNLNPVFNPNGFLLTQRGSRIANTAIAQVQYAVGKHSAFTLAGSFGVLHFRTPSFTDTRNASVLVEYSRTLTARDYLGLNYGYGQFRFARGVLSSQNHSLLLSYGRRIAGRIAVNVGGGPLINVFKNSVTGSTSSVSWTANSSLNYRARRESVAVSFARSTTSGGGLLNGANTDVLQLGWSMQLSRNWSGSLSPGYSHSANLRQTTPGGAQNTFDSGYVGASLNRKLGRYMTMFFTYNYETQHSEVIPCTAGDCRPSLLRHLVGFGFEWHPRQISTD